MDKDQIIRYLTGFLIVLYNSDINNIPIKGGLLMMLSWLKDTGVFDIEWTESFIELLYEQAAEMILNYWSLET